MAQQVGGHSLTSGTVESSGAAVSQKTVLPERIDEETSGPSEEVSGSPECQEKEDTAVKESASTCEECGGRLINAGIETYCSECGVIAREDAIQRRRTRDIEKMPGEARRCGGGPWTVERHDHGMGTVIGNYSDVRDLPSRKRVHMKRLKKIQTRSRFTSADYTRTTAFVDIKRLAGTLDLSPTVRKQACVLFQKAQDEGLLKGRTREWFSAACIYAVCRCSDHVRTVDEISRYATCEKSEITLAYSQLKSELGFGAPVMSPEEYIPYLASEVDAGFEVRIRAEAIAAQVHESGADAGRSPSGMAAAALYRASKEQGASLTQNDLGEAADVAPGTVRKSYRMLDDLDLSDETKRAGGKTSEAEQRFGGKSAVSYLEQASTSQESNGLAESQGTSESELDSPAPKGGQSMPETATKPELDDESEVEPEIERESETEVSTPESEPNALGRDTAWRPSIQIPLTHQFTASSSTSATVGGALATSSAPVNIPQSKAIMASDTAETNRAATSTTQQTLGVQTMDASADSSTSVEGQNGSSTASETAASGSEPPPTTDTYMAPVTFPSPVGDDDIEVGSDSLGSKHLTRLHSKRRRRSGAKDTFRFWTRIPNALVESGDFPLSLGDDEDDQEVQITFTDGENVDSGADMETLERDIIEGVPGLYLRRVGDDEDASDMKYVRKLGRDDLGFPVTLPPKYVTERIGMGIDPEEYSDGADLYFEIVVRGDSLVLVPVGYDDGTAYEQPDPPEPEPEEEDEEIEWRTEDGGVIDLSDFSSQALPDELVPLSKQANNYDGATSAEYFYAVYLRALINRDECEIGSGDTVEVRYESDSSDPIIEISKPGSSEFSENEAIERKVSKMRGGAPVMVPNKYITGSSGLGIDEDAYDSGVNPLLFEATVEPNRITLSPVGFKNGVSYPLPEGTSLEDITDETEE